MQRRGGMVFASPDDAAYKSETDFLMVFKGDKKQKSQKKKALSTPQHAALFQKMAGL